MNETFKRLQAVICEALVLSEEEVLLETVLGKDVKCDSLDFTVLIMKVENEFNISFGPEDFRMSLESVGGILKVLETKL